MIHDLSASTKHAIDVVSPTTATAGIVASAITMNQFVMLLTAVSLLLNIGWMILKYAYLRKHGGDAFWGRDE